MNFSRAQNLTRLEVQVV